MWFSMINLWINKKMFNMSVNYINDHLIRKKGVNTLRNSHKFPRNGCFYDFGNSIKLCDQHYYQGIPRGQFRLKLCSERRVFSYWPWKLQIALFSSFNGKVSKFVTGHSPAWHGISYLSIVIIKTKKKSLKLIYLQSHISPT